MERDPKISKLIREAGIAKAPENMTSRVMDLINAETERKPYKPIIGRSGRLLILFLIVATVVVSLIYTEPGTSLFGISGKLADVELQLP